MVNKDVQELLDSLHLDEESILMKFKLIMGEKSLSYEESLRFIAFLRRELSIQPLNG